jgi:hypothetical protein
VFFRQQKHNTYRGKFSYFYRSQLGLKDKDEAGGSAVAVFLFPENCTKRRGPWA